MAKKPLGSTDAALKHAEKLQKQEKAAKRGRSRTAEKDTVGGAKERAYQLMLETREGMRQTHFSFVPDRVSELAGAKPK